MNNYARVNINGLNATLLIFIKSWVIFKSFGQLASTYRC